MVKKFQASPKCVRKSRRLVRAKKLSSKTYLRDGKTDNVKVTLQADDGSQTASKAELPALDGATLNNYDAKRC